MPFLPPISHRIHVWYIYIYTNIWGILMVNVTIYTIHGSYGFGNGKHPTHQNADDWGMVFMLMFMALFYINNHILRILNAHTNDWNGRSKYGDLWGKKKKLVGAWATPLTNMKVNWDDYSLYIWENKIHGNQTTNQKHMVQGCELLLGEILLVKFRAEDLEMWPQMDTLRQWQNGTQTDNHRHVKKEKQWWFMGVIDGMASQKNGGFFDWMRIFPPAISRVLYGKWTICRWFTFEKR